uniref:Ion transport domain-containing protein n=1 Tax=Cynoglossus semilaevis TaxID=244447 RepID=A0A3P8X5Q6_CYNSE
MSALLPPVGTDVFRRFNSTSATTRPQAQVQMLSRTDSNPPGRPDLSVMSSQADEPLPPLEAGRPLPFVFGTPPSMYLNTPLEDLDPFYQNQTFMVLSRGNVIHRFNADSSLFLLPPLNLIRRAAVMVITLIFTLEVALKVVARGFCVGRFTFIRDPWNWLDVLVVSGLSVRSLRSLRPLRLLSRFQGLRVRDKNLHQSHLCLVCLSLSDCVTCLSVPVSRW